VLNEFEQVNINTLQDANTARRWALTLGLGEDNIDQATEELVVRAQTTWLQVDLANLTEIATLGHNIETNDQYLQQVLEIIPFDKWCLMQDADTYKKRPAKLSDKRFQEILGHYYEHYLTINHDNDDNYREPDNRDDEWNFTQMPEHRQTNATTEVQNHDEQITENDQEEPAYQHEQCNDSYDSDSTSTQEFETEQNSQALIQTPEQPVRRVQFDDPLYNDNRPTPPNNIGTRKRTSTPRDTPTGQSPQYPPFTPIRPRNPTPAPRKKDDLMEQLIYVQQVTQDLQAELDKKAEENEKLQRQLMIVQTTQGQTQQPIPLQRRTPTSWETYQHASAPPMPHTQNPTHTRPNNRQTGSAPPMTLTHQELSPNPILQPAPGRPVRPQTTHLPRTRYQPMWDTLMEEPTRNENQRHDHAMIEPQTYNRNNWTTNPNQVRHHQAEYSDTNENYREQLQMPNPNSQDPNRPPVSQTHNILHNPDLIAAIAAITTTMKDTMRENREWSTQRANQQTTKQDKERMIKLCKENLPDLRTTFQMVTSNEEPAKNIKAVYDFIEATKTIHATGIQAGLSDEDIFDVISTKLPYETIAWFKTWRQTGKMSELPKAFCRHLLNAIDMDKYSRYLTLFKAPENATVLEIAKNLKNYIDPALALIYDERQKIQADCLAMETMMDLMGYNTQTTLAAVAGDKIHDLESLISYLEKVDQGRLHIRSSRPKYQGNTQTTYRPSYNRNQNPPTNQPAPVATVQTPPAIPTYPQHPINAIMSSPHYYRQDNQQQPQGQRQNQQQNQPPYFPGQPRQSNQNQPRPTGPPIRPRSTLKDIKYTAETMPPKTAERPCNCCGMPTHSSDGCIKRNIICREPFPETATCPKCRARPGHYIWECPAALAERKCNHCGQPGHQDRNCPTIAPPPENPQSPSEEGAN
jgi:hypothetical protein